ncbi:hypothetical protein GIB67_016651 [Kingdonia uniflora]|uniref:Retrotransposon gag domain-containing protein n=1 Tax=Kingdonia uniflora TaxID=39325 RepID=A0A7J7MZ67_9MAGN|nr:hypothetical protein GIB67_016651 [Kingdonia uniflora]
MQSTISAGYLFTNNAHLIWESLRKVYSQRENNARIFQLSNEIGNFKQGTQTLGMYYARLRSSWEELSHYDSFIEWPASAPSEKVPIPPIYAKIVKKTRVFQFLAGLNPDFEYARVHLLDRTPFLTLEEAHAYCLSDQSRRSPMPPISEISSETSAMAIHYAYPAPPSVPSQTSHTSSPSLSPLPTASGLPPTINSPLSGIKPSPTASIPVTTDDDSPISHSDDDRLIAIRKEKRSLYRLSRRCSARYLLSNIIDNEGLIFQTYLVFFVIGAAPPLVFLEGTWSGFSGFSLSPLEEEPSVVSPIPVIDSPLEKPSSPPLQVYTRRPRASTAPLSDASRNSTPPVTPVPPIPNVVSPVLVGVPRYPTRDNPLIF